jgi:trimeric autotransporter adhesin
MRRIVLLLTMIGVGLLLASGVALAAALSSGPDTPTVQTDGAVRTILRVGSKVYIGGSFTSVAGKPRTNLAAINANTGRLTGWAPKPNGQVRALAASPNGTRIYAGGAFTSVSGNAHPHVVAISASTGRVDRRWKTGTDSAVLSLATSGSRVYLGGRFLKVNGRKQARLAAVEGATGKLSPRWAATADNVVQVLLRSPNGRRIYAGGQFERISGHRRLHLAALDPRTGTPKRGWRPNPCYPVFDLAATTRSIYVAGGGLEENCTAGGWAEAFRSDNGASRWRISSNGDFQAVALLGGTVYYGGHFEEIPSVEPPADGKRWVRFAAVERATGRLDARWKPTADTGVWAMTSDHARKQVYAGGGFTQINGQRKQGLARFSEH